MGRRLSSTLATLRFFCSSLFSRTSFFDTCFSLLLFSERNLLSYVALQTAGPGLFFLHGISGRHACLAFYHGKDGNTTASRLLGGSGHSPLVGFLFNVVFTKDFGTRLHLRFALQSFC